MQQKDDIISHLTQRIEILVQEVEKLTLIIHNNVNDQNDLVNKYQELFQAYQQQEIMLKQTEDKLSLNLKYHLQDNLQRLNENKSSIDKFIGSQIIQPSGTNHPLYILCQEKITIEQKLRERVSELEKQNAVFHSENARLRSFIQHDRMYQQMEQFSSKLVPYRGNVNQENTHQRITQ